MARTTRGPRSVQLLCAAPRATAASLLARHGMEPDFPTPITALHLSAAVVKDRSKAVPQWCHGDSGNVDTMLADLPLDVKSFVESRA
mmetsp:Transcript_39429/g.85041  ORF Transcript_39429/g.85041 Transcript_39429/m.85041 type:complete len:87 (-) Transcript_39429:678-938(-)